METLIVLLLCSSGLCLALALTKFLHKFWWTPMRVKYVMLSQGIRGPSYTFFHGSTKEISNMIQNSMHEPMDLSHDIFPRILPHIYSWIKLYGTSFLYWHGPTAEIVVTEPELIKEVLNNRDKFYSKPETKTYMKKILGNGLVMSEGEKWATLRKLSNHAFHAESLRGMIPAMVESVEVMLGRWENSKGKEIEVCDEIRILTSEVIARTAFGSSYLEGKQIFQMLNEMSIIAGRNYFKLRLPGLSRIFKNGDDVESDKLAKGIRDLILDIIQKREEKMTGKVDSYGSDFLGLLLKAHHDVPENYKITLEDIVDECKTFYGAGQGTTAVLLSWIVFLLALNTDWQDKVRQEVLKVLGKERPNSEGIARLKTMNMVVNETLRLYPPASNLTKKVQRKVKLGKLVLPANMNVYIPIMALHHDPKIWGNDAHLFNPERFSEGVNKATNNSPASYIPFSMGPRTCVGLNFAINEAKITLAMILQRYKFTLSPNHIHSPTQMLLVRPGRGVRITLHSLQHYVG